MKTWAHHALDLKALYLEGTLLPSGAFCLQCAMYSLGKIRFMACLMWIYVNKFWYFSLFPCFISFFLYPVNIPLLHLFLLNIIYFLFFNTFTLLISVLLENTFHVIISIIEALFVIGMSCEPCCIAQARHLPWAALQRDGQMSIECPETALMSEMTLTSLA